MNRVLWQLPLGLIVQKRGRLPCRVFALHSLVFKAFRMLIFDNRDLFTTLVIHKVATWYTYSGIVYILASGTQVQFGRLVHRICRLRHALLGAAFEVVAGVGGLAVQQDHGVIARLQAVLTFVLNVFGVFLHNVVECIMVIPLLILTQDVIVSRLLWLGPLMI